jgi:hypothetical protein
MSLESEASTGKTEVRKATGRKASDSVWPFSSIWGLWSRNRPQLIDPEWFGNELELLASPPLASRHVGRQRFRRLMPTFGWLGYKGVRMSKGIGRSWSVSCWVFWLGLS